MRSMRIEFDEYETPDGEVYEFTDGIGGKGLVFGMNNMGAPPLRYQTFTAPGFNRSYQNDHGYGRETKRGREDP